MTILTKIGLPLVLLVSTCFCGIGEVDTTVMVGEDNPPKFYFSGTGWMYFLEVSEIPAENLAANLGRLNAKPLKLIWRFVPPGSESPSMDRWPSVMYGTVPDGGKQTEPAIGPPPSLEEGKTYFVRAMTGGAGSGRAWFTVKNGRTVEIPEPDNLRP
ncbi:MAG: hypothetical protein ABIP75_05020 [Pyrinomonadaceae bacterium]